MESTLTKRKLWRPEKKRVKSGNEKQRILNIAISCIAKDHEHDEASTSILVTHLFIHILVTVNPILGTSSIIVNTMCDQLQYCQMGMSNSTRTPEGNGITTQVFYN